MPDSLEDRIKRTRKEIGGADEGTLFGDVLAVCDAAERFVAALPPRLAEIEQRLGWIEDQTTPEGRGPLYADLRHVFDAYRRATAAHLETNRYVTRLEARAELAEAERDAAQAAELRSYQLIELVRPFLDRLDKTGLMSRSELVAILVHLESPTSLQGDRCHPDATGSGTDRPESGSTPRPLQQPTDDEVIAYLKASGLSPITPCERCGSGLGDRCGLRPEEEEIGVLCMTPAHDVAAIVEEARSRIPSPLPALTGNCETDCQTECAYPGQFSECES
jgi:hypothetical protein